jgi:hypothetical protein
MLKWGPTFQVELPKRFEAWLEDLRERHPQYSNEEILFAALACGLDWLRRDEELAMKLRQWYPPQTSREQFTCVAVKMLSGRICGYIPRQAPRLHRGIRFGDGLGPW